MATQRTIVTAVAGAALVLFGGVAAVRQQVPPSRLNVDSLASELGLSAEAKDQLAPSIDKLNDLLTQADQARQEHRALWSELQDVQSDIAQALTPEQRRGFGQALREAWSAHGYGMGFMGMGRMGGGFMNGPMGGAHMHGGSMGGGHMGSGFMNGHRGGGHMHGGTMGPGTMGGSWMPAAGSMMGTRGPGGR